eukprot:m.165000 g.165000  ORF g.165000 m.165000 type:complete len:51 (-) comp18120_c0_seq2:31-183(-)
MWELTGAGLPALPAGSACVAKPIANTTTNCITFWLAMLKSTDLKVTDLYE